MKISSHNISLESIKYNDQGNFNIPIDAKILSLIFNGFDIQILYQHQSDIIEANINFKKFYWYRVDTMPHNSNIYSFQKLDLKYGTYFNKLLDRYNYFEGHILYQVEKSIEEIRDDKLEYLLK